MSELPPPLITETPANLPPPVGHGDSLVPKLVDQLTDSGVKQEELDVSTEISKTAEAQKFIGSTALDATVSVADEDPNRTLTREEIDALKLQSSEPEEVISETENSAAIDMFAMKMIGDKDPARIQARVYAATDYLVERYASISSGPNGFGEALGKLGRIAERLHDFDQRDPENNKQTRLLINEAEEQMNSLLGEEEFVSGQIDKSLFQGESLSNLRESTSSALESANEAEEISDEDRQFNEVGHSVLGSLQEIVANSDATKQGSPAVRAEITRLFATLKDKISVNDFDPRDIESALALVRELRNNVDNQRTQTDKMKNKSNELAVNAGILFKMVQAKAA